MTSTATYWLFGILMLFYLILVVIRLVRAYSNFSQTLKRVNREIQRTGGSERTYWIQKKRKLWLSLLPFTKH